jgi:hypothetical protein
MKFLLPFFILVSIGKTFAQSTEETQIKNTVNVIFEAMKLSDSTLLKTVLDPGCSLQTVGIAQGKPATYKKDKIENFIKSIGTKRPGILLDERLLSFQIHVDEALAIAWTPYEFYINDTFSHSGTNVFTLVKTDSTWKIVSIIDTRKKEKKQ